MSGMRFAYFANIAAPLAGLIVVFIVPMLSAETRQEHQETFDKATRFHRQGLLPEAVYEYGQAIAAKPDFAEAYAFRGQAWLSLCTNSQALRDFNRASSYKREGFTKKPRMADASSRLPWPSLTTAGR